MVVILYIYILKRQTPKATIKLGMSGTFSSIQSDTNVSYRVCDCIVFKRS